MLNVGSKPNLRWPKFLQQTQPKHVWSPDVCKHFPMCLTVIATGCSQTSIVEQPKCCMQENILLLLLQILPHTMYTSITQHNLCSSVAMYGIKSCIAKSKIYYMHLSSAKIYEWFSLIFWALTRLATPGMWSFDHHACWYIKIKLRLKLLPTCSYIYIISNSYTFRSYNASHSYSC